MSTNVSATITLTRGQWRILRAICVRLLADPIADDAARVVRRVLDRIPV